MCLRWGFVFSIEPCRIRQRYITPPKLRNKNLWKAPLVKGSHCIMSFLHYLTSHWSGSSMFIASNLTLHWPHAHSRSVTQHQRWKRDEDLTWSLNLQTEFNIFLFSQVCPSTFMTRTIPRRSFILVQWSPNRGLWLFLSGPWGAIPPINASHHSLHWHQQPGIIPDTNTINRALILPMTPTMGHYSSH